MGGRTERKPIVPSSFTGGGLINIKSMYTLEYYTMHSAAYKK